MTNPIYTPPEPKLKAKMDELQNVTLELRQKEISLITTQEDIELLKSRKSLLEWETGSKRKGVEL